MQIVSEDDVRERLLKSNVWAGGERCIQTGKMLEKVFRFLAF